MKLMNQKGLTPILIIFGILMLLVVLGGIFFFRTGYFQQPLQTKQVSPSPNTKISASTALSVNSPNPTNQQFTIDLPSGIKLPTGEGGTGQVSVSIQTVAAKRASYKEIPINGCPGPCYSFAGDTPDLEQQFEILTEASRIKDCNYSTEFTDKINYQFKLFASGIESKKLTQGIYNPNLGVCGIKYIATDGYDVFLGNYKYEAGFIKDDKIIDIRFELLPQGINPGIDQIWQESGFISGSPCDEKCAAKQNNYFENLNLNDSRIQNMIKAYDKSVVSFKLQ